MKERVTVRRNVEQIIHCAREALSVLEHNEDNRQAIDDLESAADLIAAVLPRLRASTPEAIAASRAKKDRECGKGGCDLPGGHMGGCYDAKDRRADDDRT